MTITKTRPNPWLVINKPNPEAPLRLFCFSYAGGGASFFRTWADALAPAVELCSVQLPGREGRMAEPLFRRLGPLVESLAEAISTHLDKPFAFFGHSMGGLVGFELARYLRRGGLPLPLQLFVSGCRAPQVYEREASTYDLPDAELLQELSSLNGTPKEVLEHAELLMYVLPIVRADLEALETYEYKDEPALSFPIAAYGGQEDYKVSREHLEAWGEQTESFCTVQMFPGDHFFLRGLQAALIGDISRNLHARARQPHSQAESFQAPALVPQVFA